MTALILAKKKKVAGKSTHAKGGLLGDEDTLGRDQWYIIAKKNTYIERKILTYF